MQTNKYYVMKTEMRKNNHGADEKSGYAVAIWNVNLKQEDKSKTEYNQTNA